MSLFDKIITHIIAENEGGFVNDPDDAGGPTKYGITQYDLSAWNGTSATVEDVRDMSYATAKSIYFDKFWRVTGLEQITSEVVATCIMDTGVLYGVHNGVSIAQRSLNDMSVKVDIDGKLGPITAAALNSVEQKTFVKMYVSNICDRINEVIAHRPSNEKYRHGWINRAQRLLFLA